LTRRESQELTRRRLIESAAGLFAEHGVRGTSLIAVAENRRVQPRGGPWELLRQGRARRGGRAVRRRGSRARARPGPELAGSANDRLAAYISTHIDYCRREPARAAAIIAAVGYLSRPAAPTQSYGERSADSIADLVALFEDGQRRGEMRSFDPATMALSLRSVLDTAVPTHPSIEAHEIITLFDHATRAEEAPQ
jgi:AcrR family transcriptional regulator